MDIQKNKKNNSKSYAAFNQRYEVSKYSIRDRPYIIKEQKRSPGKYQKCNFSSKLTRGPCRCLCLILAGRLSSSREIRDKIVSNQTGILLLVALKRKDHTGSKQEQRTPYPESWKFLIWSSLAWSSKRCVKSGGFFRGKTVRAVPRCLGNSAQIWGAFQNKS